MNSEVDQEAVDFRAEGNISLTTGVRVGWRRVSDDRRHHHQCRPAKWGNQGDSGLKADIIIFTYGGGSQRAFLETGQDSESPRSRRKRLCSNVSTIAVLVHLDTHRDSRRHTPSRPRAEREQTGDKFTYFVYLQQMH